jgi:hypothetical protein
MTFSHRVSLLNIKEGLNFVVELLPNRRDKNDNIR